MLYLCVPVHPSHLNWTIPLLTSHSLFYPLYPFVTLLCNDDFFVPIQIFQTAYLRLWIMHTVPRPQNNSTMFYTNNFTTSLCTAYQPTLITICIIDNCPICKKTSYCMIRFYFAHVAASIPIEIAVAYRKPSINMQDLINLLLWKCIGEIFPFNLIDGECIFLRVITEISVSSDDKVRYNSECKIFNPSEINEDDSNIPRQMIF